MYSMLLTRYSECVAFGGQLAYWNFHLVWHFGWANAWNEMTNDFCHDNKLAAIQGLAMCFRFFEQLAHPMMFPSYSQFRQFQFYLRFSNKIYDLTLKTNLKFNLPLFFFCTSWIILCWACIECIICFINKIEATQRSGFRWLINVPCGMLLHSILMALSV